MAKENSKPVRVDIEMDELISKTAKENDITKKQASREIARQIKLMKQKGEKIWREIKF